MQYEAKNISKINLNTKLAELEAQIAIEIGPHVLDYLFLFQKRSKINFSIEKLSMQAKNLLQNYILLSNEFLKPLNLNIKDHKDIFKNFNQNLQLVYYVRYIRARANFVDYQIVRVPSPLEQQMLDSRGFDPELNTVPATVSLLIPNAFVTDENGELDVNETIALEKVDFQIVSYLSLIGNKTSVSQYFFITLSEVLEFKMIPLILKNELLEVIEVFVENAILFFTRQVYKLIDSGKTPQIAKKEVANFYANAIKDNQKFPLELKELENHLTEILSYSIDNITELYSETKLQLVDDFKKVLLALLKEKALLPINYYKIKFRMPDINKSRQYLYNFLLDVYLILENGKSLPLPVETYNIDFTFEAKEHLFSEVTLGNINPEFTLEDYLALET